MDGLSKKGGKRGGRIALFAIAVVVSVIFIVIIISSFSFGSLVERPPFNPFIPGEPHSEAPPRIIMVRDNDMYQGELLGYTFGSRETILDIPEPNIANISNVSEGQVIDVVQGSTIRFTIEGTSALEAQPDSLSATAYTEEGQPVGVLDARGEPQDNNTYTIDMLESGQEYVLVLTATWIPEEDREVISGYVIYGFRIHVT